MVWQGGIQWLDHPNSGELVLILLPGQTSLAKPNTSLEVYRSRVATLTRSEVKGGLRAFPNEDGSDNRLVSKPRSKLRCK